MILKPQEFFESIGNVPIFNLGIYNKRMEMGWEDKLFFLDMIDPSVIVDFGCADGAIIKKMKKFTKADIIGYEPDADMLSSAKSNLKDIATVTDKWSEVIRLVGDHEDSAILLSSVIHEVYSYSSDSEIESFWKKMVFNGAFKWICIRDMMPSVDIEKGDNLKNDIQKVRENADKKLLDSYESIWGKISDYKSLMHFLLKYKYIENWEREVEENYFSLMLENFYKLIPPGYKIIYKESFQLPHHRKQFRDDFGIDIDKKTHTKMIILNTNK